MECPQVFEQLSADVDGELPADEVEAVRRHLLSCADCAQTRLLLTQARRTFRSVALAPVSASFDEGVFRRMRRDNTRVRWWLSAAAGLAAMIGVIVLRYPSSSVLVVPAHGWPTRAVSGEVLAPPGWSDGRIMAAADCARPSAGVCHVETPCGDAACRPLGVDPTGLSSPSGAFIPMQ